jgi:spore germination protein GerM
MRRPFDGSISRNLRRSKRPDVQKRSIGLVLLIIVVAGAAWYYRTHRNAVSGETLPVYYTKLDGTSLGVMRVSLRERQPGETYDEHRHNTALYAAVEALAGPPSDVPAVHFPAGTRVNGVTIDGSTATVDLSQEVTRGAGGAFGENGEFKALVYTMTALPGISSVQILVQGNRLDTLPGGHLELDEPLRRADW